MKTRVLTEALEKFLGKPYALGCRGNGYDCLGLLWALFSDLGVELPKKYGEFNADNYAQKWAGGEGRAELFEYLESLGKPVGLNYVLPGDILFYEGGFGIYTGAANMVIVAEAQGVVVMPLKQFPPYKAIRVSSDGR